MLHGLDALGDDLDRQRAADLDDRANQPALGGVYKLVAREKDGRYVPVIKISANPEKVSNPGFKDVYRLLSRDTGKAEADYGAAWYKAISADIWDR